MKQKILKQKVQKKKQGDEWMKTIEKYEMFETEFYMKGDNVILPECTVFKNGEQEVRVSAFKKYGECYGVRFMPQEEGIWEYQISCGDINEKGMLACVQNTKRNHGPVKTKGFHFQYADGGTYIPFGTTCYAWIHQTEALQSETLQTLEKSPFNKIRMCVFPKSMPYNNNDPDCYPFLKGEDGTWDVRKPDPKFWEKLDLRIKQLMELGIEADVILFHPYDRWGFAELSQEESLVYLEYCIARLSAYRNIWWSLANEYETVYKKQGKDWDEYGEMLYEKDPYRHLTSIHNIVTLYPKRRWMTHCSVQTKKIDRILFWKEEYQIPILIDECGYEGDLPFDWGSLTAFEMVHRFWWSICRGGFCTHGETFHREDEVLWWAKGGKLYGESADRIGFLKGFLYTLPGEWQAQRIKLWDPNTLEDENERNFQEAIEHLPKEDRDIFMANVTPMKLEGEKYSLEYFGRIRPVYKDLQLREDRTYRVEMIDSWEMTRSIAAEKICGNVRIELPGKEGIALLVTEISER